MTDRTIDTVIWLGAGASRGSQIGRIEHPLPVTDSFFSNGLVQELMPRYPALDYLWGVFGRPSNLEHFWRGLDDGCNEPSLLPACDVAALEERLRDGPLLPDAEAARKEYYRCYVEQLTQRSSSIETYINGVFVAGWELKHLLVRRLDLADLELELHDRLFRAIRGTFGVVSFNYDIIAERALTKVGLGFTYEATKPTSAVLVAKPHGSIQWEWLKPSDAFIRVPTMRAEQDYGVVEKPGEVPKRLFFRDPLMIGLRTKRELTGEDAVNKVNRFWDNILSETREILQSASSVVIIGFSFQEADSYLWDTLSATRIGRGKRVLVCDRKAEGPEREEYIGKVKRFFGTEDVTPYWGGFDEGFIARLSAWAPP